MKKLAAMMMVFVLLALPCLCSADETDTASFTVTFDFDLISMWDSVEAVNGFLQKMPVSRLELGEVRDYYTIMPLAIDGEGRLCFSNLTLTGYVDDMEDRYIYQFFMVVYPIDGSTEDERTFQLVMDFVNAHPNGELRTDDFFFSRSFGPYTSCMFLYTEEYQDGAKGGVTESQETTAETVPVSAGRDTEMTDVLRYDGLYYYRSGTFVYYLRFYPDGTVLCKSSYGGLSREGKETLGKNSPTGKGTALGTGTYTVDGSSIQFREVSEDGSISYWGEIVSGELLILNHHSYINGFEAFDQEYGFEQVDFLE